MSTSTPLPATAPMRPALRAALIRGQGLATRRELLRDGVTQQELEAAWRSQVVVRVRHGLYADPRIPPSVLRAARVGGPLAGPSALALAGAWQPHGSPLFVSTRDNDHRLRDPDDAGRRLRRDDPAVVVLRDRRRLDPVTERVVVTPATAVQQTVRELETAEAVAVLDSAVRSLGDRLDLGTLRTSSSRRLRDVIALVDPRAEAGTESVVRVRLHQAGIPALPQARIAPGVRCDLLIGDRLVVECVSVEHHGDPEAYNRDRRRISDLVLRGYTVLEFSYPDVLFDWPRVLATIEAAMWTSGIGKGEIPEVRRLR